MEVVVLDKGDAPGKDRVEGATENALQVVLARVVGGMCLAGKDDLHRPAGRVQDASQAIGIAKDERGPLVAREPAGESQCERVVVEHRAGRQHAVGADAISGPERTSALADERKQMAAQRRAHGPELLVRDLHDAIPERRLVVAIDPVATEVAVEQPAKVR